MELAAKDSTKKRRARWKPSESGGPKCRWKKFDRVV